MVQQKWEDVISWLDPPLSIAKLNAKRSDIPDKSGFYVFTDYGGPLIVNKVLYIGETRCLSDRLPAYLVNDPTKSRNRHKGAQFIGDHRVRLSNDHAIYLRWSLFEGADGFRRDIEAAMIQYYKPDYNDRDWNRDHGIE